MIRGFDSCLGNQFNMSYQLSREALILAQANFNKAAQFELVGLLLHMFSTSPGINFVGWVQSFTDETGSGQIALHTTNPIFFGDNWTSANPWVIVENPDGDYAKEIAPNLKNVDVNAAKKVAVFLHDPLHADMLLDQFGDDNSITISRSRLKVEPLCIRNIKMGQL